MHTVRYLKFKQVAYRLYYRFRKPKPCTESAPNLRNALVGWSGLAYVMPATHDGKTFTFLGTTAQLNGDWNSAEFPKLWLYNLHYHDDLNAKGADERFEICSQLVDDWIAANPTLQGNGWEPYCISLRVVNWVKWLSRLKPEEVKPDWVESLASQIDALDQQLEHHILANHLFANAKALVFAGVFFGGQQGEHWLQKGLKLLDQEVAEQFLADGAHYELSPMYHAILLWDLADLICLQRITELPELQRRAVEWKPRFLSGIHWLQSM
ncbi:MAG: heparinase II/III family protein, partial [Oceanospirillum sp.]|nr:heparinase II/III family protein [Oceanospirillum sp.]